MNVPKAAVILVHYEDYAEQYFAECYQSLVKQSVPADSFTVFIVNNGSTEDLSAAVGPIETRFIDQAANLGWSSGNNAAIKIALAEKYDPIIMLNMDTLLDPDWLKELLAEAARRPDIQIFQSKVLLYDSRRINSAGNRIHFLGYGFCHGYGREEAPALPEIEFASGASMLVKSDVFRKIGLFRENYFIYYDDLEFGWRARVAGYRIGLAEKSICFHKYVFSTKLKHLVDLECNRLLTMVTLEKPGTLLLIAPPLLLTQFLSGLYLVIGGFWREELRICAFFLKTETWRTIAATRREIRGLRVKKDRELVWHFSGRIIFSEIKNPVVKWLLNPILWTYWNIVKRLIFW